MPRSMLSSLWHIGEAYVFGYIHLRRTPNTWSTTDMLLVELYCLRPGAAVRPGAVLWQEVEPWLGYSLPPNHTDDRIWLRWYLP